MGTSWDKHGRLQLSTTSKRINATIVPSLNEAANQLNLDDVEVLYIDNSVPAVDLTPLLGSHKLRTLHLQALPTDPRQLLDLPGLQYVSADLPVWQALLDAKVVPPGLAAAGFHEDAEQNWNTQLTVMNTLLAHCGQNPMTTTRLSRGTQPPKKPSLWQRLRRR